jgi:hypothetical protein
MNSLITFFLGLSIPIVAYHSATKMSSFSKLKYTPDSIKKMPHFEHLVDKCTEESKEWGAETKMVCIRIL